MYNLYFRGVAPGDPLELNVVCSIYQHKAIQDQYRAQIYTVCNKSMAPLQ